MTTQSSKETVRNYMEQDISGKTPAELLMLLYDAGLRACRRRDRQLAIGVLVELMGGIDVTCGELTDGLIRLYEYALRQVRENKFEFAETMLRELAEAYRETMSKLPEVEAAAPPQPVD